MINLADVQLTFIRVYLNLKGQIWNRQKMLALVFHFIWSQNYKKAKYFEAYFLCTKPKQPP